MPFIERLLKHCRSVLVTGAIFGVIFTALPVTEAMSETIVVEGNHRADSDYIRQTFLHANGDNNQAVKELYATGLFGKITVNHSGGRTIVHVEENEAVNRVAFEGNSKMKSEILAQEVQTKSHGAYDPGLVQSDIERIKDAYRRGGRVNATVTARTVPVPNGKVDVVFSIDEGDKTGVKSINFVGNHVYSSDKLRNLMEMTEMNFMSWLKNSDVYEPDRLAQDEELIRRYYLKNGYADFHIISSDVRYDAEEKGYIITITVEEGGQYHVASVAVESHIANVSGDELRQYLKIGDGDVYNGDMVQKSVDVLTTNLARRGYAFNQVRPQGDRDQATHTLSIRFVVDDGPRVYIERINIHGNTRTRDYVIRREFDIGEGDAYNRVMIDRAERRLNALGYFKKVKITNLSGSSPDKVIVDVDIEDQPTGSFSVSGGYSTTDGFLAEVSVTESNFLGRGQYIRVAASRGQYSNGYELSFTEPYFLDQRMAAGFDVYRKENDNSRYADYTTIMTGGTLRLGLPLGDELTLTPRYSVYTTEIKIPNSSSTPYDDCSYPIYGVTPGAPGTIIQPTYFVNCLTNGETSLAVKQQRGTSLTSMLGYALTYDSLDNRKNPSSGVIADFHQDFAGVGGNSKFVRTAADIRYYREVMDDVVGIFRVQGGNITGFGDRDLKMTDNFNLGNQLVRGFAAGGIGPRDVSTGIDTKVSSLGGSNYYGASLEFQAPVWGLPREVGLKAAVFADAGSLFDYQGKKNFGYGACIPQDVAPLYTQGTCLDVRDKNTIRSSIGAGLLWASPLGPLRINYAYAISKDKYDRLQAISFSGGAPF